jgi:tRNA1Val (adenine37-N6)-methyltransferase
MANNYFDFKQFRIEQDRCAMKVTSDSCVFGGWVAERLQSMPQPSKRILDIGAGTGLLSLMIAQAVDKATIDAIEIDPDAANQARENIERSPWKDSIRIQQGDVLEFSMEIKYDVIVTNPPFYEDELTGPDKKKNQAHHDESLPLSNLFDRLGKLLQPTGRFYLLLPSKGFSQRLNRLHESGLNEYGQVNFHHSEKHPTSRIFLEGGLESGIELNRETILLQDATGGYTDRVRMMLQQYYLAF